MYTKTVYSLIYPETKNTLSALWNSQPHELYEEVWSGKQDGFDKEYFQLWKMWVEDVISIPQDFSFEYFTSGSSEGIRASIASFAAKKQGVIHIFKGEYEGYKAYAEPLGVRVIEHDREGNWKETLSAYKESTDQFYLSHPSSIDGNIWEGYEEFVTYLAEEHTNIDVMLDLCYVGVTTHNEYTIPVLDNVKTIFFSLSKVFGVYYHRIGGVLSREAIPILYGNVWFKNLFSIELGKQLMTRYRLGELPQKYAQLQENFLEPGMKKSDVFLLATSMTKDKTEFSRSSVGNSFRNRFCLTTYLQQHMEVVR